MDDVFSVDEHLKPHFDEGRRLLVVAGPQAFIARPDAVFKREGGPGPVQFCIVDLRQFCKLVEGEVGNRRKFTERQILRLAHTDSTILGIWRSQGAIGSPVKGRYALSDAFAAALCGTLRRRGVHPRAIAKVGQFVRTGQGVEAMV